MVDPKRFAEAIRSGDVEAVESMIAGGADVNALAPEAYFSPLETAIEQMHAEIVRKLVAAGADVNRDTGEGWTPLAHAIDIESDSAWQAHYELGHETTELTEILLEAGAIPTNRALGVAQSYNNQKACALLHRYMGR